MAKKINLTEGGITKNLVMLSWPIMLGMTLQAAFNIVDTIFIGMLGPNELAAIAITFPVVFVFIAMASGLSIGSTILVSQSIGEKKFKNAQNVASHSIAISLIVGVTVAIFGLLYSQPLFVFMGADETILPLTIEYSKLIFIGFIFMFIGFIGQGIMRAEGDSKTPFKFQLFSVVLNIILDPLLIFGLFGFPALGITGAALATVIARSIGAALIVGYLFKKKAGERITLSFGEFKFDFAIVKRIFSLGMPASLGNITTSIGMILMTSLIGAFGSFAIAAYGIGLRLDSVVRMPMVGLMMAIVSITGQNIGAKQIVRIRKTIRVALKLVIIVMLFATILLVSFPAFFFKIFSSDPDVISIGVTYLSIVTYSYLFMGIGMTLIGVFQGAGKTRLAAVLMAVHWLIALALAFWLKDLYGLSGIWIALLGSSVLFSFVILLLYRMKIWVPKEMIENIEPGLVSPLRKKL